MPDPYVVFPCTTHKSFEWFVQGYVQWLNFAGAASWNCNNCNVVAFQPLENIFCQVTLEGIKNYKCMTSLYVLHKYFENSCMHKCAVHPSFGLVGNNYASHVVGHLLECPVSFGFKSHERCQHHSRSCAGQGHCEPSLVCMRCAKMTQCFCVRGIGYTSNFLDSV